MGEVSTRDRFRGCLVGLAAGDALGTTLEFSVPGSFDLIDDMVGGGRFGLRAGQWTDDTSMALCLATSLLESGGFDPVDQMGRYLRWFREGYLSSTGRCFDIGGTTREALVRFERTGEPYSGPTGPMSAGNGSLMRLAPVPMFFAGDAREAIDRSADSSRTTHGAVEAVDACRCFAGLLVGALRGVDKETLLSEHYSPVEHLWDEAPLAPKIAAIADGSFRVKQPPAICATGYVVDTLEAVLWAFLHSEDFREGALKVVNLGDDADTTGAIFGQIAGAYYGIESIPAQWRQRLTMNTEITSIADRLREHALRS
ncbi:MAG: ADP-ribosylglycohydrolase family protein [Acidimicrobiaceae bacterium]|nr:ADP-ribosylglycohydrolase family protein [Acidimicrobiaceae bacterium]